TILPTISSHDHIDLCALPHLLLSHFFFSRYAPHHNLHSFPTRRSSDLHQRDRALPGAPHQLAVGTDHDRGVVQLAFDDALVDRRSEEHTSELQSLGISYAVFCLKKKNKQGNWHLALPPFL